MNKIIYFLILTFLTLSSCNEEEPEERIPIFEGIIEVNGQTYSIKKRSVDYGTTGNLKDYFSSIPLDGVENFAALILGIHLNDSLANYVKAPKPSIFNAVDSARLYHVLSSIQDSLSIAKNVVEGEDKLCFTCYTHFTKPGFSLTMFTHFDDVVDKIIYSTAYGKQSINVKVLPLSIRTEELPIATRTPATSPDHYSNTTAQIINFEVEANLFNSLGDSIIVKGNLKMIFYSEWEW